LSSTASLQSLRRFYEVMYEVDYNGRTSCVRNYFYCRIRSEDLLYCWARPVGDS